MRIFLSHAFEDKEAFAQPLADALKEKGYEVWYDKDRLHVGDWTRQEIERALAECDFGVVLVSPRFLAKKWTQAELDGLFARESPTRKLILPVWLDVTREDVVARAPMLAARHAALAATGVEAVVAEIEKSMAKAHLESVKSAPAPKARRQKPAARRRDKARVRPAAFVIAAGLIALLAAAASQWGFVLLPIVPMPQSVPLEVQLHDTEYYSQRGTLACRVGDVSVQSFSGDRCAFDRLSAMRGDVLVVEVSAVLVSGPEVFLGSRQVRAGEETSVNFTPETPSVQNAQGYASATIRQVEGEWWINATASNPAPDAHKVGFECFNSFTEEELPAHGEATLTCASGNALLPATSIPWRLRTLYDTWRITDAGLLLPSAATAQPGGEASAPATSPVLKVLNVYGTRPGIDASLNRFKVYVEHSADAPPADLSQMIIRFSDGTTTINYAWSKVEDNASMPPKFELSCIRGVCDDSITTIGSNDLAELVISLPPDMYVHPRTSVQLTLIPETGDPLDASFKSPATYGTDTTITLR